MSNASTRSLLGTHTADSKTRKSQEGSKVIDYLGISPASLQACIFRAVKLILYGCIGSSITSRDPVRCCIMESQSQQDWGLHTIHLFTTTVIYQIWLEN